MTDHPAPPAGVVPAAPANADQRDAWDGDTGSYWAEHADRYDAGVAAYRDAFLAAAAVGPSDAVLDVGCGSGQTTRDAARAAHAGSALGVDLSSRMLDLARRRAEAEGLANVRFVQADAQTHPFPEASADVAISRSGTMFFDDPEAAFTRIRHALRPGGRLLMMTWQPFARQTWLRAFLTALSAGRDLPPPPDDAPSPVSLSDPDRVRRLLTAAGFAGVALTGVERPLYFGPDADDACRFISGQFTGMLADLSPAARDGALDALRADMAAHTSGGGVLYDSAAWMVEARRP